MNVTTSTSRSASAAPTAVEQKWASQAPAEATVLERQVAVKVFCGPCQKKTCPLDHRCMTRMTPEMVIAACERVLAGA